MKHSAETGRPREADRSSETIILSPGSTHPEYDQHTIRPDCRDRVNPTTSPSASVAAQLREETFACGGVRLNVAVGPRNGPPLVLLHGVTRGWRDWLPIMRGMSDHWQIFALDQRGHGASDRVPGAYRVADFAGDAAAFLREHVGESAVLWGHSLGAMTAAAVAARAPENVRALVLEDPPGTALVGSLAESRYALQFTGVHGLLAETRDVETLTVRLATLPVQHPRDGRIVEFRELRDEAALRFSAECLACLDATVLDVLLAGRWLDGLDWFGDLARIACPTLLLRADPECGGMLSLPDAARITGSISSARRIEFPGIGHSLHATAPGGTLAHVLDFLHAIPSVHVQP